MLIAIWAFWSEILVRQVNKSEMSLILRPKSEVVVQLFLIVSRKECRCRRI